MGKLNDLVVRYDNKMNLLAFKNLSKNEINLFFELTSKFKDKGKETLTFSFNELGQHLDKKYSINEIGKIIEKGVIQIMQTPIRWEIKTETQHKVILFTLFNKFIVDFDKNILTASINDVFLDILNNFSKGFFTTFELAEFSSLSSKYTQTLYRLLKQFKKTGLLTIKWDEFLNIMDIPKSYPMGLIEKRILKTSIKELTELNLFSTKTEPIFKNLMYRKIRGSGRGRPVERIEFYFLPETDDEKEQKLNEKALQYIAQDIQREQAKRSLKRSSQEQQEQKPKKDLLTGQEIKGYEQFKQRNIRIYNEILNQYDTLKFIHIEQDPTSNKIIAKLKNMDDGYQTTAEYESLKHLENVFKKYGI